MVTKIPKASLEAIIEILEERFPDQLPSNIPPTEHLYMLIGQQQVVRYLKQVNEATK